MPEVREFIQDTRPIKQTRHGLWVEGGERVVYLQINQRHPQSRHTPHSGSDHVVEHREGENHSTAQQSAPPRERQRHSHAHAETTQRVVSGVWTEPSFKFSTTPSDPPRTKPPPPPLYSTVHTPSRAWADAAFLVREAAVPSAPLQAGDQAPGCGCTEQGAALLGRALLR